MILAGDEHPAGIQVLHRVVGAMVAELHLEGAGAAGQPEDLVAEADAEHGNVGLEKLAGRADGVVARLGVAGTVGQEDAVGRERQSLLGAGLRRHDGHAATKVRQQAQDVALDAEVVGHDVQPLVRADGCARALRPDTSLVPLEVALGGNDLGEVHALQARELARGLYRRAGVDLLARHDAAGLCAGLTQDACQAPRIDSRDRHDASALQELAERLVGAPVARARRQIADDEARGIDLRGLEVLRRGAGVADVRTGECDDLAGIGGVGEDLLIAGQRGVENDFAVVLPLAPIDWPRKMVPSASASTVGYRLSFTRHLRSATRTYTKREEFL